MTATGVPPPPSPAAPAPTRPPVRALLPGVAVAAAGAAAATAVHHVAPGVSVLLVAIVLGIALTNVVTLPPASGPGLRFTSKTILRVGVALLGLQLALGQILDLGWPVLVLVVCSVAGCFAATLAIGRALGMEWTQTVLIASGFSICGAAAIAAAEGVVEPEDERETVTALALVVLFGTLMIPLMPIAVAALGLGQHAAGLWAGSSVHEVAQVVAVGGSVGSTALAIAVVVKLARVLMLAPTLTALSIHRRRRDRHEGGAADVPLVPFFVLAFIALMLVRSADVVPHRWVAVAADVQLWLLAAAMFALGMGVRIAALRHVGARPAVLAAAATVVIASIGLAGALLIG